jgi:hypothetical protein
MTFVRIEMVRRTPILWTGLTQGIFQVPVIAVFTKYDQFRRNIKFKLEDQHRDQGLLNSEAESVFNQHYLAGLGGPPPFIRLEGEVFNNHERVLC